MLFGPHETNLARGRAISDRHVAYYARRAAGGCGVVVTETASVHPSDQPYERAPLAAGCGPGWAAVVAACRPHGALVLASLGHTGGQGTSAWSEEPLWAPSRVPDVATRELPVELDDAELAELVDGFGAAARTALAAGVDGVEIDAGARSLLRAFASGLTNLRTDGYGTDRLRLLREVLGAVRAELGAGRVLALRLSCDEQAPWAGITPELASEHVARLAPLVDLLVVVRGSALADDRPDGHTAAGFNRELTRTMKAAAAGATAVVLQGSVVDAAMAQAALDDGTADAVEMTRAQIADACLVGALRGGRAPRPCTLCNQACRVRDVRNPLVSCVADPDSGHEGGLSVHKAPRGPGAGGPEVLVVGAGPAGLEAARVLAGAGRAVRVADRAAEPGGALRLVARLPGRARFGDLADWLTAECRRLGVRFDLGAEVAEVTGSAVVATGSRPRPPGFAVSPGVEVLTAAEVLAGVGLPGSGLPAGPVVVHDPLGGPAGVGVAELLARNGREVAVVTPGPVVGERLGGDLVPANARLAGLGVRRETAAVLREVGGGTAVLADRWTGRTRELPCAVLVDAGPALAGRSLTRDGTARDGAVRLAGDAVAPRTVLEAVLEGRRAALALLGA